MLLSSELVRGQNVGRREQLLRTGGHRQLVSPAPRHLLSSRPWPGRRHSPHGQTRINAADPSLSDADWPGDVPVGAKRHKIWKSIVKGKHPSWKVKVLVRMKPVNGEGRRVFDDSRTDPSSLPPPWLSGRAPLHQQGRYGILLRRPRANLRQNRLRRGNKGRPHDSSSGSGVYCRMVVIPSWWLTSLPPLHLPPSFCRRGLLDCATCASPEHRTTGANFSSLVF